MWATALTQASGIRPEGGDGVLEVEPDLQPKVAALLAEELPLGRETVVSDHRQPDLATARCRLEHQSGLERAAHPPARRRAAVEVDAAHRPHVPTPDGTGRPEIEPDRC